MQEKGDGVASRCHLAILSLERLTGSVFKVMLFGSGAKTHALESRDRGFRPRQ